MLVIPQLSKEKLKFETFYKMSVVSETDENQFFITNNVQRKWLVIYN